MRWNSESKETKINRLEEWKWWFAWRPIRIDDEIFWLQNIQRRLIYDRNAMFIHFDPEYKIPCDPKTGKEYSKIELIVYGENK